MATFSFVLNSGDHDPVTLPSPATTSSPSPEVSEADSVLELSERKPKPAKDAAIFVRHELTGPIRYRPWEEYDAGLRQELEKFSIHPLGKIGQYHRSIPYTNKDSSFCKKTARSVLSVFQYTFRMPEQTQEYVVVWDYTIGLVRITPFFKCLDYPKTVPSKVICSNSGLRELCHSVTGGVLTAQGYWMPFEAARAVAATFCHSIRFALVPLFGPNFVDQCTKPGDGRFENMTIDPKITQRCAQIAEAYRREALNKRPEPRSCPKIPNQAETEAKESTRTKVRAGRESASVQRCNERAGANSTKVSTSASSTTTGAKSGSSAHTGVGAGARAHAETDGRSGAKAGARAIAIFGDVAGASSSASTGAGPGAGFQAGSDVRPDAGAGVGAGVIQAGQDSTKDEDKESLVYAGRDKSFLLSPASMLNDALPAPVFDHLLQLPSPKRRLKRQTREALESVESNDENSQCSEAGKQPGTKPAGVLQAAGAEDNRHGSLPRLMSPGSRGLTARGFAKVAAIEARQRHLQTVEPPVYSAAEMVAAEALLRLAGGDVVLKRKRGGA